MSHMLACTIRQYGYIICMHDQYTEPPFINIHNYNEPLAIWQLDYHEPWQLIGTYIYRLAIKQLWSYSDTSSSNTLSPYT